jgi:hypothetical protein
MPMPAGALAARRGSSTQTVTDLPRAQFGGAIGGETQIQMSHCSVCQVALSFIVIVFVGVQRGLTVRMRPEMEGTK